jgi:TetR/AcrR family transcriptional regulator
MMHGTADLQTHDAGHASSAQPSTPVRKRPKPGERRLQILQALAVMLERPGGERVTTAALAAHLQISEAALYRHFASKAQMFEGLIEFIEQTVFSLVQQVALREESSGSVMLAQQRAAKLVRLLLQFGDKNPGMVRVMVGDALVFEHERLQQRMNQFFDKFEAALRQTLRGVAPESETPTLDAQVGATVLVAFAMGRLQRFARSGFRKSPLEHVDAALARMLG